MAILPPHQLYYNLLSIKVGVGSLSSNNEKALGCIRAPSLENQGDYARLFLAARFLVAFLFGAAFLLLGAAFFLATLLFFAAIAYALFRILTGNYY